MGAYASEFNRYLDRNQVNLIDREADSEVDGDFVLFDDIVSINTVEKEGQDVHMSLYPPIS